jgi:hypothetical protein
MSGYRKRPVGLAVGDITARQSTRCNRTAFGRSRSAGTLPDWDIHAASLSQPKEFRMAIYRADVDDFSYAQSAARWCRGCIEDAHDYGNRFLHSQRNVELSKPTTFGLPAFR